MSISRVFGVGLFLISPFVFAELPSTNSSIERKIDAQQQKQQAEQDAAILWGSDNICIERNKKIWREKMR